MPELDPQLNEKLATALSGDTELYNSIITHVAQSQNEIKEKEEKVTEMQQKYEDSQKLNAQYTSQIANLVSKLPVGSSQRPESYEEKRANIKERSW